MILVDKALKAQEEQGKPIRVAMIGAGFMGQGLVNQIVNSIPGMRMVAVSNRHLEKAFHVYRYAGIDDSVVVTTQGQLEDALLGGRTAVTDDAFLLARSEHVDVLVDVTGSVEFGAHVVLEAFQHSVRVRG
jgi:predicted homoserine dehydrogenase-like protein